MLIKTMSEIKFYKFSKICHFSIFFMSMDPTWTRFNRFTYFFSESDISTIWNYVSNPGAGKNENAN